MARVLRGCGATRASIEFLDEVPTFWKDMIKYLKGEFIVRPQYQKKYKTKSEVKAYNDGIQCAINMIGSYCTQLKNKYPKK